MPLQFSTTLINPDKKSRVYLTGIIACVTVLQVLIKVGKLYI